MQNEKENSGVKTRYSSPKQKLHQQAEKINEEASKVEPRVRKDAGELVVIIKAKEFSKYVLNASRKMPRDHRFVVSANIQRLALSLVENLVRANGVLVQAKKLIFALLYLNHIDRIIKEKFKFKYYVRYMDDLLILHNDKEFLETIFADLKQEILARLQF